jgi:hypothetical protein
LALLAYQFHWNWTVTRHAVAGATLIMQVNIEEIMRQMVEDLGEERRYQVSNQRKTTWTEQACPQV